MTGSAKQSIVPHKGRMDCFVADAPRNDDKTHFRIPAARFARALQIVLPNKKRAQGTPGACCTRGLACKKTIASAHEHTGTVGAFRRPCAMVLRLMPCSPRRRIRLVTVIGGLKVFAPGWVRKTSADLTPATGAGTTRFCRTHQRRSSVAPVDRSRAEARPAIPFASDAAASTASLPNVADDHDTPPLKGQDGGSYTFDLPVGMNKKISLRDRKMTRQRNSAFEQVICPSGNLGRGLMISDNVIFGRTADYAFG
ncbi:hypothetical protein [Bradyrhizobium sp. AZCC 2289]|uniref:hypothetical protein n=1 Tax=Bradyrhizobium sp. AZCC 2289 TaxID=3117026 RepID=UPI002FF3770C